MKKRFWTLLMVILSVVAICLTSKPFFKQFINTETIIHKIGCRFFEFNTISVKTTEDIDLQLVTIKSKGNIVFENGKQVNRLGQYYGTYILKIYYDDVLISEVGHWKKNNWFVNDYFFNISQKGSNYFVNHQILGPDSENENFQKRYIYNEEFAQEKIEYLNADGGVYRTEYN